MRRSLSRLAEKNPKMTTSTQKLNFMSRQPMFSSVKSMKLKLSFKIDQSPHFVKPLVPIAIFPGSR